MIALVQRSLEAQVTVAEKCVGKIDRGLAVFLGVVQEDMREHAALLARKIAALRIFEDENGKMNRSILETGGKVLAISNFTLCANAKKGTRPSYDRAMRPQGAIELYDFFCDELLKNGVSAVEKGVFGAYMQVSVCGDGPVSIVLDTEQLMPKS